MRGVSEVRILTEEFMRIMRAQAEPSRYDGNDIWGKLINLALAIFAFVTFLIGGYNMR